MNFERNVVEIKKILHSCGQDHIVEFIGDVNSQLFSQLSKLDIAESVQNFETATKSHYSLTKKVENFSPVQNTIDLRMDSRNEVYERLAMKQLKVGKVAAIIMSGGQGTRLGYDGPKGMYNLGLLSSKTIFQIHIERIMKIRLLSSSESLPIYIMTSDLNHQIILDFFEQQNYFQYPKKDIIFFQQGLEPCFTLDGKMIFESYGQLSLAPDGNGGIYKALVKSGALNDMTARGVQHLHIYGIDNILTKSLDPIFLGCCIYHEVECGNKVVWRSKSSEKVGVTAQQGNHMHIIEYSEIPKEYAESVDQNGKFLFGAANICNHYIEISFLKDVVVPNIMNSYHVALKKIPYYDIASKQVVKPTEVNGIKLELFIFDVFPLAKKWIVCEVNREDEFAPVKNAPGSLEDSPDTARQLLSNQSKCWLQSVGCVLKTTESDTSRSVDCEISPLLSYAGEGLEAYRNTELYLPIYLQ